MFLFLRFFQPLMLVSNEGGEMLVIACKENKFEIFTLQLLRLRPSTKEDLAVDLGDQQQTASEFIHQLEYSLVSSSISTFSCCWNTIIRRLTCRAIELSFVLSEIFYFHVQIKMIILRLDENVFLSNCFEVMVNKVSIIYKIKRSDILIKTFQ